ncbi:hypothetical protein CFIMG_008011RA00001 [Ceratocystis fimbriata CBS 114723]|uniref:RNA polymerase I-specific transcription initiation factor rrn5 n=1 Tax=Ceratocystis fimbriata CBS 114723 TaxID=1035309 RepID=A0A2C5XA42_9PEZI|nr:hypothetical protein CFIMG_008011RA00001 [Ceratocystis fimbriata CBS 114723]
MDSDASRDDLHIAQHNSPQRFLSPSKRKRASSEIGRSRPFKRRAGQLYQAYIDILNQDTEEARLRICLDPSLSAAKLSTTQIGCTIWSEHEKQVFFDAISRLGRDNIAGIAGLVRSKSEVEIAQYMAFLNTVKDQRWQNNRLPVLHPADIPAAVEISQPCVIALENAADAISLRQDQHEEAIEKRRWGENLWRVDSRVADELELEYRETCATEGAPFATLLRTDRFLQLARRIFMNAAVPEYNWEFVDDQEPSIRATALQDFYALVVSMTRRIVHTSLCVASGRIAAKSRGQAVQNVVRQRDVEAAVASMGLKDSKEFWATAPRRLRLKVIDDSVDADDLEREKDVEDSLYKSQGDGVGDTYGDCDNHEIRGEFEAALKVMTYDEIESLLMPANPNDESAFIDSDNELYSSSASTLAADTKDGGEAEKSGESHEPSEGDNVDEDDDNSPTSSRQLSPFFPPSPPLPNQQITDDLDEIFAYTAVDFGNPHSAESALLHRLRVEKAYEDAADAFDADAARTEERRLWEALGTTPPQDVVARDRERERERTVLPSKGQATVAVSEMYSTGAWR